MLLHMDVVLSRVTSLTSCRQISAEVDADIAVARAVVAAVVVVVAVPAESTVMAAGSAHASIAPALVAPSTHATAAVAEAATWKTSLCINVLAVLFLLVHVHCRVGHFKLILFGVHLHIQLLLELSKGTPVPRVATMTSLWPGTE